MPRAAPWREGPIDARLASCDPAVVRLAADEVFRDPATLRQSLMLSDQIRDDPARVAKAREASEQAERFVASASCERCGAAIRPPH